MSASISGSWKNFCQKPSEENFAPIYEETKGLAYTLCYRILRDEEDAKEAFQCAYGRLVGLSKESDAIRQAGDLRHTVGRFAILEANSLRKRRARRQERVILLDPQDVAMAGRADSGLSPRDTANRRQLREKILAILSGMEESYRLPIVLHYFDGMTHQEIAELLESPVKTISTRISRALKKLEPEFRKAGLGEAAVGLAALIGAVELLSPPAALTAAVILGAAEAILSAGGIAGGVATGAGVAAWKSTLAGVILSTKGGIFASGIGFCALMFVVFAFHRKQDPNRPEPTKEWAVIAQVQAPESGTSDLAKQPQPSASSASSLNQASSASKSGVSSGVSVRKSSAEDEDSPLSQKTVATPPKVGVIFSASSSEGTPPTSGGYRDSAYGYYAHLFSVGSLKGSGFDVYAVVEPGTETKGQLPEILNRLKLADRIVNGADEEALKKLDAIGSLYSTRLPEPVVEAVMKAVSSGVGFTCIGDFGSIQPGNSDELHAFLGLDQSEGNYRQYRQQMNVEVVAPQEMLVGAFAARKEFAVTEAEGFTGIADGTPLMAIPESVDPNFCPMFMRAYGKGRMIVVQTFSDPMNKAAMLQVLTLTKYVLNWVSHRPMDANWVAFKASVTIASADDSPTSQIMETAVKPLEVGVLVSEFSRPRPNLTRALEAAVLATADNPDDNRGSYRAMLSAELAGPLARLHLNLHAILEPQAKQDERAVDFLETAGLSTDPIDAQALESLKKLNVILSMQNPYLAGETIEAIHSAVQSGVGFFTIGEIGVKKPEDAPVLEALMGIKADADSIEIFSSESLGRWVENPSFASPAHHPGDIVKMWYGISYKGAPDGDPLIVFEGGSGRCVPAYTRRVGYGRVMVWPTAKLGGSKLEQFEQATMTDLSYFGEALNWTAGRPLN